jgi:outer membrane protein OmpA-like peptidoglycan-associated protein
MRSLIAGCWALAALLSVGSALAQKPSPAELAALSHVQSAFATRADAGVVGAQVTLGPELERRFGMPSGTSGARVYRAMLALLGEDAITVRRASGEEIAGYVRPGFSPVGSPVFVLAGAGVQLLAQYDVKAGRISYVGQLGATEPPPAPAPPPQTKVELPKPEPVRMEPVKAEAIKPEPEKPGPLLWTVQFDYKSARLSKAALAALEGDVAPRLPGSGGRRVHLGAYTDGIGSAQYNEKLSRQRADAVQAWLVAKGVPADSIEVTIRGAAVPVKACEKQKTTASKRNCLAPNRRVVIEMP